VAKASAAPHHSVDHSVEHNISQAMKAKRKGKLQQALTHYYCAIEVCSSNKLERLAIEIEEKILKKNHPDKYKILIDFSNPKQMMQIANTHGESEAKTLASRQIAAGHVLQGEYQKALKAYSRFKYLRVIDKYFLGYAWACVGEYLNALGHWQTLFGTNYETAVVHFLEISWSSIKRELQEKGKLPFRLDNKTTAWVKMHDNEFINLAILYTRQINKETDWQQTIKFINKFVTTETATPKIVWIFGQALYWRAWGNQATIPQAIDYLIELRENHRLFQELGVSKEDYIPAGNDIVNICWLLAERVIHAKIKSAIMDNLEKIMSSKNAEPVKLLNRKDHYLKLNQNKNHEKTAQALPEAMELPSINPFKILQLPPSPSKADVLEHVAIALKKDAFNIQNVIKAKQVFFEKKHKFLLNFLYAIPSKPVFHDSKETTPHKTDLPPIWTSAS